MLPVFTRILGSTFKTFKLFSYEINEKNILANFFAFGEITLEKNKQKSI